MGSARYAPCCQRLGGQWQPSLRGLRWALRTALAVVLLLAALIGAAGARAAGATLYVDGSSPSCSDSGSGAPTQPFCTIGAAAAQVSAGQTVQVAAGTYSGNVAVSHSGSSSAPIVFTAAPGATVTLSGGSSGFTLSSVSWVTVSGFAVTDTSTYGINVTSSSHVTLSGNNVSYAGEQVKGQNRAGIRLSGVTSSLVAGNVSDHNSDYGIVVLGNSTGNELRGNQTFNNAEGYQRAAAGIRLYQSPGNVVDRNISYDNEDSGIECYSGANNTLIYDNVVYDNGDHGIDDYVVTGQRIIDNTVYDNVTAGINVEGGSTGATIADNISVDNGIKSPRTHSDIRVESGSTAGTTMRSDLVYLSVSDTLLIWNSVNYTSLAAFQAATGQESNGIQANPLWENPTLGDFQLTAGSPAIDSADSGVSGWPTTDIDGIARIDDPATPNTGQGPVPYADRGAYEYIPATPHLGSDLSAQVTVGSGTALAARKAAQQARVSHGCAQIKASIQSALRHLTRSIPQAFTTRFEPLTAGKLTEIISVKGSGGSGRSTSGDVPTATASKSSTLRCIVTFNASAGSGSSTAADPRSVDAPLSFASAARVRIYRIASLVRGFTKPGRYKLTLKLSHTGRMILRSLAAAERAYFRRHPHGHHPPSVNFRISLQYAPRN